MEVGSLLTPLWWLWYGLAFLLSQSWALAVFIAVLSTVFLAVRQWRGQNSHRVSRSKGTRVITKPATLVQELLQVLPVHPHNGWSLDEVSHGLRVFTRFFPSLGVPGTPCLATSILIDTSPKKLLAHATSGKDIPNWVAKVTTPPQYIQQPQGAHNHDADIIKLTFEKSRMERLSYDWRQLVTRFTQKYARFLDGIVALPTNFYTEVFDREWKIDGEGCGSVCWVARQPSHLPYHWSMLLFTAAPREKGMSIATLVMLPKSPLSQSSTSSLLTSQMVALQHFISLRRARAYSSLSSSPTPPRRVTPDPTLSGHMTSPPLGLPQDLPDSVLPLAVPPLEKKMKKGRQGDRETPLVQYPVEKPAKQVSKPVEQGPRPLTPNGPVSTSTRFPLTSAQPLLPETTPSPPSSAGPTSHPSPSSHPTPSPHTFPYAHLDEQYAKLGRESCRKLVAASKATKQDGWITVGTAKGVLIMKNAPRKGEGSVNCIKGTGLIQAPPEFVFRLLRNPENNSILDDLLKETRIIHKVSESSTLVHLLYKSVWSTAPRDFTAISTAGRYDEHTLVEAGVSVMDPRAPEEKGYVRGNIVCGGYVVKVCPGQPEQCEVTYVSQVELKGNIPTFAVNKVTESQPQCISRLRAFAENSYAEMKEDPQKMTALEESVLLGPIFPPPPPPPAPAPASSSPPPLTPSPGQSVEGGGEGEGGGGGGGGGGGEEGGGVLGDGEGVGESVNSKDREGGRGREEGEVGRGEEVRRGREEGDRSVQSMFSVGSEAVDAPPHQTQLQLDEEAGPMDEEGPAPFLKSWAILSTPPPEDVAVETVEGSRTERLATGSVSAEDGLLVMETLETYTPDQITTDEEGEEGEMEEERGEGVGQEKEGRDTDASGGVVTKGERETVEETEMEKEKREEEEEVKRVRYEKNLPPYQAGSTPVMSSLVPTTEESISYPRQESGGVDYRTLGNQTAARVLEELFHVSNLNLSKPGTFQDQESGWKFVGIEKDVLLLKKKTPRNPFHSVMGKGLIHLPPQEVYDSIRNPQLRFTYDNMLKELHIVKQIEDGLYILHIHHETTQCFIRQSRDFCVLVNERREGDKLLLVGTSVETPECPINPSITRGKITYSGWVVESCKIKGKACTEITYLLQVDLGGIPAALVNHISKRQPLAISYLRDYLISTSLLISSRESSPN